MVASGTGVSDEEREVLTVGSVARGSSWHPPFVNSEFGAHPVPKIRDTTGHAGIPLRENIGVFVPWMPVDTRSRGSIPPASTLLTRVLQGFSRSRGPWGPSRGRGRCRQAPGSRSTAWGWEARCPVACQSDLVAAARLAEADCRRASRTGPSAPSSRPADGLVLQVSSSSI